MSDTPQIADASRYMRYLPAVFAKSGDDFLGRYLKIFEKLLTGLDDGTLDGRRGIQELLADGVIGNLFYSRFTQTMEQRIVSSRNSSAHVHSAWVACDRVWRTVHLLH